MARVAVASQLFDPLPSKCRIFKPSYVLQSIEGRLYYHDSSCTGTTDLILVAYGILINKIIIIT